MGATLQQDRCTQNDYVRLFEDSAEPLRWLCYTLTGDEELSAKILEAALRQSLKGADRVFREWMASWARRLIIQVCIDTVRPTGASLEERVCPLHQGSDDHESENLLELVLSQSSDTLQDKLLRLQPLSRFVFVLRALEGYSRRETALFLEIGDRACESIYTKTVKALQPTLCVLKTAGTGVELVAV